MHRDAHPTGRSAPRPTDRSAARPWGHALRGPARRRGRRPTVVLAGLLLTVLPGAPGAPDRAGAAALGPVAYVVDMLDATVSKVDLLTHATTASNIRASTHPRDIALTPDLGTAVVTDSCFNTVDVTKIATGETYRMPVSTVPWGVAAAPDGRRAYVTNHGAGTVSPITLGSPWPGSDIPVGDRPMGIAITGDGDVAVVANSASDDVTLVDLSTHTPAATVEVGDRPTAVGITGGTAWVTNSGDGTLTPVDLTTGEAGPPVAVGGEPVAIAMAAGSTAWVADGTGAVVPVDLAARSAGDPVVVGGRPQDVVVGPDGDRVYVVDHDDGTLVSVDVASRSVDARIGVGNGPFAVAIGFDAEVSGSSSSRSPSVPPVPFGTAPPGVSRALETAPGSTPWGPSVASTGGSTSGSTGGSTGDATGGSTSQSAAGDAPLSSLPTAAYVANVCDATVSRIDPDRPLDPVATIPVGTQPAGIAVTPDGAWAYVANFGDGTVTPIDVATDTPGPPIEVGWKPTGVAVEPDGDTVWVAGMATHDVTPIDVATGTAGPPVRVTETDGRPSPVWLAIEPDGSTLWVVNYLWHSVVPIDLATRTVGEHVEVGLYPSGMAITPDGTTGWVTNAGTGDMTPVDLTTRQAGLPVDLNSTPTFVAVTPDGTKAYVPVTDGRRTLVADLTATPVAISEIAGPFNHPQPVAVSPDGATVLVGDYGLDGRAAGNTVTPIDVAAGEVPPESQIRAGYGPEAIAFVPDQAPTAAFGYTPAGPGEEVAFDASASTTPDGTIVGYHWSFGDGAAISAREPTVGHTYAEAGEYFVTLRVENSRGTSDTRVFTGQTVSNNGGPAARISRPVVVGTFTTPDAPTGLVATAGTGEVALDWEPPADDGGARIESYRVYRSDGADPPVLVGETTGSPGYIDGSARGEHTYEYTVTAVNAAGEGPSSSPAGVTVPASPPDAPSGLGADRQGDVVSLAWMPPDDNGHPITGYRVYRGAESGSLQLLADVGTGTAFHDPAPPGGSAYYQVSAVNAVGEGPPSRETAAPGPDSPVIVKPDGSSLQRGSVRFAGSAPGRARVEIVESGQVLAVADATASGAWEVRVALPSGEHTVTAVSIDGEANRSADGVPVTFDVDAEEPSLAVTTPSDDYHTYRALVGDPVVISGSAGDNWSSGTEAVWIRYTSPHRPGWQSWRRAVCDGCGSAGAAEWFDQPTLEGGVYEIEAVAFDEAGNVSVPVRRTFVKA